MRRTDWKSHYNAYCITLDYVTLRYITLLLHYTAYVYSKFYTIFFPVILLKFIKMKQFLVCSWSMQNLIIIK